MAIFPVVMCGGGGTRLWPTSRPSRPKQFIPFVSSRSLFQDTILRVGPLARDGGQLIVVAGVGHLDQINGQLEEIAQEAIVILEPAGRDSAGAMAAAAAWIGQHQPEGIAVFVASDHHISDAGAFQTAVFRAAEAAKSGRIVTLGIKPVEPSSAYGYIQPAGADTLSEITRFIEKPNRRDASAYVEAGYLWNSGNFIVSSQRLMEELRVHAPEVAAIAEASLKGAVTEDRLVLLSDVFLDMPKISIDYAVMEKTRHASVLKVDFNWSDLGAWDAIAATGADGVGARVLEASENCLVRAASGMVVAVVGGSNLAVIAEKDAVLVCDLSRSQDIKTVVERLRTEYPAFVDFARPEPSSLAHEAGRLATWLKMNALPVWATLGQSQSGLFEECLTTGGAHPDRALRSRVQTRQAYAYARAGELGWRGPWSSCVTSGLAAFQRHYGRGDATYRTLVSHDGAPIDDTAMVYDQAFALFGFAAAARAGVAGPWLDRALALRNVLMSAWPDAGGLSEQQGHPFQSNPHMHLLEACLAWEALDDTGPWAEMADRIVELALSRFIDGKGVLREFFSHDWTPARGHQGRLVEPGHQFEWCWLLVRYGRARRNPAVLAAARRLYDAGMKGVDASLGLALDLIDEDGHHLTEQARLWPQTEWLKASLILAEEAQDGQRKHLLTQSKRALDGLTTYLQPDGLWRDKRKRTGFIVEPSPASSLYHIMAAFDQLRDTCRTLKIADIGLS